MRAEVVGGNPSPEQVAAIVAALVGHRGRTRRGGRRPPSRERAHEHVGRGVAPLRATRRHAARPVAPLRPHRQALPRLEPNRRQYAAHTTAY